MLPFIGGGVDIVRCHLARKNQRERADQRRNQRKQPEDAAARAAPLFVLGSRHSGLCCSIRQPPVIRYRRLHPGLRHKSALASPALKVMDT
jgi:hypothetical protein